MGIVLFCLSFPDQALARSSAAIAEARKLASSDVFGCALEYRHQAPFCLSEMTQSWVSEPTQLVAVATEQRFPVWRAEGTIYRGWVKAWCCSQRARVSSQTATLNRSHRERSNVDGRPCHPRA